MYKKCKNDVHITYAKFIQNLLQIIVYKMYLTFQHILTRLFCISYIIILYTIKTGNFLAKHLEVSIKSMD